MALLIHGTALKMDSHRPVSTTVVCTTPFHSSEGNLCPSPWDGTGKMNPFQDAITGACAHHDVIGRAEGREEPSGEGESGEVRGEAGRKWIKCAEVKQ